MKVSRTINRLHFEDLEPSRFEDLCLMMVYRLHRWRDIHPYGRSGADDGIDIEAIEELDNQALRRWYVQCKRYQRFGKAEIRDVINSIKLKNSQVPDILLLIVSCDVSKKSIEYLQEYANEQKIGNPTIWTASVLETKLYSDYHDLLFAYFGVNVTLNRNTKASTIRRNIRLKEQMHRDFITPTRDPMESIRRPFTKFCASKIIIHSIDDSLYPNADMNSLSISGWFRVEPFNFYFNGFEVIIGVRGIIINEDDEWDLVEYDDLDRKGRYHACNALEIGRIPFENIIDYDLDGDEYYNCPHMYCDFRNGGQPYEDIVYSITLEESKGVFYNCRLDNSKRKSLP